MLYLRYEIGENRENDKLVFYDFLEPAQYLGKKIGLYHLEVYGE